MNFHELLKMKPSMIIATFASLTAAMLWVMRLGVLDQGLVAQFGQGVIDAVTFGSIPLAITCWIAVRILAMPDPPPPVNTGRHKGRVPPGNDEKWS